MSENNQQDSMTPEEMDELFKSIDLEDDLGTHEVDGHGKPKNQVQEVENQEQHDEVTNNEEVEVTNKKSVVENHQEEKHDEVEATENHDNKSTDTQNTFDKEAYKREILEEFNKKQQEENVRKQNEEKLEIEKRKQKEEADKLKEQIDAEINFDPISVLSDAEKEILSKFNETYEDTANVLNIQNKVFNATLANIEKKNQRNLQAVYDKVVADLIPVLAPLNNYVVEQQSKLAFAEFEKEHPDWNEHKEGINNWVNSMKGRNAEHYKKLLQDANKDDMIEIYDTYKQLHGIKTRDIKAEQEAERLEAEKIEEAKKQAQQKRDQARSALASPKTKQTKVNTRNGGNEDDFDPKELFAKINV